MKHKIITRHEEEVIKEYLQNGKKLEGFRLVKFKAKRISVERLEQQLALLKRFLKAVGENQNKA